MLAEPLVGLAAQKTYVSVRQHRYSIGTAYMPAEPLVGLAAEKEGGEKKLLVACCYLYSVWEDKGRLRLADAYLSIVRMRQHTSAYVSIRVLLSLLHLGR
jgi:hypothetical protein